MREIKFRAWNGKKMYEVYNIDFTPNSHIGWSSEDYTQGEHPLEPLMQFTGLKDKNGREIWEGDIVRRETYLSDKWEVNWSEDICGFRPFCDYDVDCDGYPSKEDSENYEVIGNIYEDGNLL